MLTGAMIVCSCLISGAHGDANGAPHRNAHGLAYTDAQWRAYGLAHTGSYTVSD